MGSERDREFNLNSSHFPEARMYSLSMRQRANFAISVEFKIYFYEEYDAGKPVILSLEERPT